MSSSNLLEWQKYKSQLIKLEEDGDGHGRTATQVRATLIQLWNKLAPEQQREMAMKYIPQSSFSQN